MLSTEACIKLKVAKLVVPHAVEGMHLSAIVERSVLIVCPVELLRLTVPVLDVILTMLAVSGIEVACLQISRAAILIYIGERSVAVPVVLFLIATRTLVASARLIKHVAFGIFT